MMAGYTRVSVDENEVLLDAEPTVYHNAGAWNRTSKLAAAVVGLVALGGVAAYTATRSAPTPARATTLTSSAMADKVYYGALSEDQKSSLFEDFIVQHSKPYATDADTKATRYEVFKANLDKIDNFNKWNPSALFSVTERADWTDDELGMMRGIKSSTLAKKSGGAMSSWEIMKNAFPDQDAILLGEKGPEAVEAEAIKHKTLVAAVKTMADSTGRGHKSVGGTQMSEGMFPWVTAADCAACKMFPHFADYTWDNLPTNFDWRELGAVSAVLNQKYCGSCWTFSTAQDIEGAHFLATGELNPLSEQQLVACDVENDGCDGGYPFMAMQYIHKIGGMLKSKDYPYKGICAWDACDTYAHGEDAGTPTCDTALLVNETQADNVAAIGGFQLVSMGSDYEELLRVALVKNGPLSVAFNADGMDYYVHGITGCTASKTGDVNAGCISDYETCNPDSLDHAVLLVGYGVEDDIPYWVIKNSWADTWGEEGYFRIIRGINRCGVANMVVHSVIKDA